MSSSRNLTPFDTNWKKGSGATPLTIQDLLKWIQFSIPTAPTKFTSVSIRCNPSKISLTVLAGIWGPYVNKFTGCPRLLKMGNRAEEARFSAFSFPGADRIQALVRGASAVFSHGRLRRRPSPAYSRASGLLAGHVRISGISAVDF